MRSTKSSLTKLRNLITEKLPPDNDLYGYAGINVELIQKSLAQSYAFVEELERQKETFEVIILKRNISKLTKLCCDYLNQGNLNQDNFNEFLNWITEIKFQSKQTYFLIIENSIRDEEEISKLRSEHLNLKNEIEDYKKTISDLIQQKEKAEEAFARIINIDENVEEADDKILKLVESSKINSDIILEFKESSSISADEIESLKNQINDFENIYNEKSDSITKIETQINEFNSVLIP